MLYVILQHYAILMACLFLSIMLHNIIMQPKTENVATLLKIMHNLYLYTAKKKIIFMTVLWR